MWVSSDLLLSHCNGLLVNTWPITDPDTHTHLLMEYHRGHGYSSTLSLTRTNLPMGTEEKLNMHTYTLTLHTPTHTQATVNEVLMG